MNPLDRLIGETLVFGIPGPRVTEADLRLFRETGAGGLILYRINFRSPNQIRSLIRAMEGGLGRRLLVTVDHEGGRVVMFQSGVTVFPDNRAFGAAGRADWTRDQGRLEGRELRRLGIDVNLSPTVDVLTEDFSPNIGIRSYGGDPRSVARLAVARIGALQSEGVSACAKHFPGLGPATLDPHLALPVIRAGRSEIGRRHLVPFRAAISAGVDMVMSSHPLYPALDRSRVPATFSRALAHDLLRGELGFGGVAVSDDLEMGALRGLATPGRAAVLAARAGHDLLLSCHRADWQRRVFLGLREAYRSGELKIRDLEASVERIRRLRGWARPRFGPGRPVAEKEGDRLALAVSRAAVQVVQRSVALPLDPRKTLILFPELSEAADRIMVEPSLLRERSYLRSRAPGAAVEVLPLDPRAPDIARALATAKKREATVFFCYDGHLQPGNKRLLEALQRTGRPLALVLMRDPYDQEWAAPSTTVVTAFGYRERQVRACLERIFSAL